MEDKIHYSLVVLDEALKTYCHLCKIINPQHKDCVECLDMDIYKAAFNIIKREVTSTKN